MATKSEYKYERLRKIGIGSYGVVFKCVNRRTGQIVAIKRYSENDADPIIRKIAMREVRMLGQLRHPNLINLLEVFRRKRRLHLVFDYCELTVLDVIEKYTNNCPLNLIKKIIWQTVNAINYCHTHNCIHRDIKPENILINQAGIVKLCDFGFARTIQQPTNGLLTTKPELSNNNSTAFNKTENQIDSYVSDGTEISVSNKENTLEMIGGLRVSQFNQMTTDSAKSATLDRQALTEYVATRWYRSPELLIGEIYYDIKIDIWAIGCVAAELMRGSPLWPGKTDLDQLCMIKNSLGQLTASQINTLLTQSIYDQANIDRILNQTSPNLSESLDRRLPTRVGQSGIDFVVACLKMDPAKRPTSDELLKHAYIHSTRMLQFVNSAYKGNNTTSSATQTNRTSHHRLSVTTGIPSARSPNVALLSSSNGETNLFGRLNSQKLMVAAATAAISVGATSTPNSPSNQRHLKQQRQQKQQQVHQSHQQAKKRLMVSSPTTNLVSDTLKYPRGKQATTIVAGSSIPRAIPRFPRETVLRPNKKSTTAYNGPPHTSPVREPAPEIKINSKHTKKQLPGERRNQLAH